MAKNYTFQNLQPINFLKKEFPISTEKVNDHYSYKNQSFFKILEHEKHNFLYIEGIPLESQNSYLQETCVYSDSTNRNDNITLENLLKIDFMKIFHKNPSQVALGREENDFSPTKKLKIDDEVDDGGNYFNLFFRSNKIFE